MILLIGAYVEIKTVAEMQICQGLFLRSPSERGDPQAPIGQGQIATINVEAVAAAATRISQYTGAMRSVLVRSIATRFYCIYVEKR